MQALEVPVFEGTTVARRMTRSEYEELYERGYFRDERVELIHGIVVRMSPIGPADADVVIAVSSPAQKLAQGHYLVRVGKRYKYVIVP